MTFRFSKAQSIEIITLHFNLYFGLLGIMLKFDSTDIHALYIDVNLLVCYSEIEVKIFLYYVQLVIQWKVEP